jgi:hypothetical protein
MEQARRHFSKDQLSGWAKESETLNARRDGDAGGYVLRRA